MSPRERYEFVFIVGAGLVCLLLGWQLATVTIIGVCAVKAYGQHRWGVA